MKGKLKKTLLGVAAVAFTAACVSSLVSFEANASVSEGEYFTMKNGASVRTSEDTSGIRFSFTVSEAQEAKLAGYDVEYGMLITQKDVATIENILQAKANVFDENSEYTFDVEKKDEKKLLVNITGKELVDGVDEDAGKKVFNAALTNISKTNYTVTYVGVGYIKATDGEGNVNYYFEAANNNERTISYVAEKAIAEKDKNAVGSAVVANYVSGGYDNLGLSVADIEAEAGTETNPYIVEESDCTALVNATNNNLIYGANTFMTLENSEDITTKFNIDRKYQFVWAEADTALGRNTQVELFNAPSKEAAAYNFYTGADTNAYNKNVINPSASYKEEFNGKYGVVSFKSTEFASDLSGYENGWAYRVQSVSGFKYTSAEGSNAWDNLWEYMTVSMYVEGEPGESVTVSGKNKAVFATVNCNEWVEVKIPNQYYKPYNAYLFNEGNPTRDIFFVINDDGADIDETTEDITLREENPTVYIDSIGFGGSAIKTISVEKVEGAQQAQIMSVEKWGWAEEVGDIVCTAKTPAGNDLTITDGKFVTGVEGTYTVTASASFDGEIDAQSTIYTVEKVTLVADRETEIEGFYNEESKSAVYGVVGSVGTKVDATTKEPIPGNAVEWHEEFNGRYGVVSMKPAKTANAASTGYGGAYYIGSNTRAYTWGDYDTVASSATWTYVSMWIYIVGEPGEKVQVSAEKGLGMYTEVPCNEWWEYKVYRETFTSINSTWKQYLTLSTSDNANAAKRNILWVGSDATANYTVYVDSMSYVTEATV